MIVASARSIVEWLDLVLASKSPRTRAGYPHVISRRTATRKTFLDPNAALLTGVDLTGALEWLDDVLASFAGHALDISAQGGVVTIDEGALTVRVGDG